MSDEEGILDIAPHGEISYDGIVYKVDREKQEAWINAAALVDPALLITHLENVFFPLEVGDPVRFCCRERDGRWVVEELRRLNAMPLNLSFRVAWQNVDRLIQAAAQLKMTAYGMGQGQLNAFTVRIRHEDGRFVDIQITATSDWVDVLQKAIAALNPPE